VRILDKSVVSFATRLYFFEGCVILL